MTFAVEIPTGRRLYDELKDAAQPTATVRRQAHQLSGYVAEGTRQRTAEVVGEHARILCTIILRGGAVLYPAFANAFPDADFCLLGCRRTDQAGLARVEYATLIPRARYDATVYIDCICATGGTILAASQFVGGHCQPGQEIVAVISSTNPGTSLLTGAGIGVVGLSLFESHVDGVVAPDLGSLDAGDLFSGVGLALDHEPR